MITNYGKILSFMLSIICWIRNEDHKEMKSERKSKEREEKDTRDIEIEAWKEKKEGRQREIHNERRILRVRRNS